MKLVCVVLAGGEGRRMGGEKPLRPFGSTTLLSTALRQARGYADTVAVAVRVQAQVGAIEAPLLTDDPTIPGPLAGLAAALAWARRQEAEAVLTLPCDSPQLPPDLAHRLAAALADHPQACAALPQSAGQLHPTCGLWRAAALDELPVYRRGGGSSLRGFAKACDAVTATWDTAAGDPFANANTPEELAALQPPPPRT